MNEPTRSRNSGACATSRLPRVAWHRHAMSIALALSPPLAVAGAQRPAACADIAYVAPAPDKAPAQSVSPAGQAVYAEPGNPHEDLGAGGVCVALFGAADRTLVRADTTDARGLFEFDAIPQGDYVLVVGAKSLHAAVRPVHLGAASARANLPRLLVHLHETSDPRGSHVTLVTDPALRRQLLAHVADDQAVRNAMIAGGADHAAPATLARIDSVDAGNLAWMRTLVRQRGWPGRDLVGMDGTEAAFLLVQHAGHGFQKEMLPLVEAAYRRGDLAGQDLALLTDRVLVGDHRPQRYGTQALPVTQWVSHEPALYAIEDSAGVDARRAQLGMQPLAEYLQLLKRMYFPARPRTAPMDGQVSRRFVP